MPDEDIVREVFVVPSELVLRLAEGDAAGIDRDHGIGGRGMLGGRGEIPLTELLVIRKVVEEIREGFGVHMAVLDGHLQDPGIEILQVRVDPGARLRFVLLDFGLGGPVAG